MSNKKRKPKKKPLGELFLVLPDKKSYDFFKLPHEVRQKMLLDFSMGPEIRAMIDSFKNRV